jgi:hypothetical protein
MLTGKQFGVAIATAIRKKGVSKADVARHFGIKPPSISDWCNRGTVDKSRLEDLFAYFSDVVGPEHWGLQIGSMVARSGTTTYRVTALKPKKDRPKEELVALYSAMTDTAQQQLIGMAKLLAQQFPRAKANRAS